MMFNFKNVLCGLLVIFVLGACTPKTTPSIVYENFSDDGKIVKNIKVKFNKVNTRQPSQVKFCGIDISTYNIGDYDNFFGPIHAEWENAKGKKLTKDLVLTKDQLPNFTKKRSSLSSVYLYFTQNDVHLYTSDTPNIKQIREDYIKKAGITCQEYRDREFIKKWGKKCLEEGCDEVYKTKSPAPAKKSTTR